MFVHFQQSEASDVYEVYLQSIKNISNFAPRIWLQNEWQQVFARAKGVGLRDPQTRKLQAYIVYHDLPDALEILQLGTHPDWQRRGLMKRLMTLWLGQVSKPVWLEVHIQNRAARNLYQKVGFRETGRRPRYYSDGGTAVLFSYD